MKIQTLFILFITNIHSSFGQQEDSSSTNRPEINIEPGKNEKARNIIPRNKISIELGYSYKFGKVHNFSGNNEYLEGLQRGIYGEQSYIHYLNRRIGLGVKANIFHASNSKSDYLDFNIGQTGITPVWRHQIDDILLSYLGPTFSYRFYKPESKTTLYINTSVGYQSFSQISKVSYRPVIVANFEDFKNVTKGNTIGYIGELGIDRSLSNWLSIGLKAEFISGTLKKARYDGIEVRLNKGLYEKLDRFNLSTGVKANF